MDENNQNLNTDHYYGDYVRYLFLAAAIVMFLSLPVFFQLLNMPASFSTFGMVILLVFAGLTNPKQVWTAVCNVFISVAAFLVFDAYTVSSYTNFLTVNNKFFVTNLLLGLIFLPAVYYSVKTLRAMLSNK